MSAAEESENTSATNTLGYTQSKVIRFNYTWVLKNFSFYSQFESPIFSAGCNGKLTWYLKLKRASSSTEQAVLCLLPCNISSKITGKYMVSFLDARGNKALFNSDPVTFECKSSTETTAYSNRRSIFEQSDIKNRPGVLMDDKILTVFCEIELVVNTYNIPGNITVIDVPQSQLLDNIGQLFEAQQLSDVTIDVCGLELPAHKTILSVRSRVFSAMFEHEFTEKQKRRVEVTDVEPEVFREMLRYIYTDQVQNIDTMADKLLMAAEKYELERLKLICEEALRVNLTTENAVDTLILADLHCANQLKAQVKDFITLNTMEVMNTTNFKSMVNSHPYLIAELLQASAMRQSPEEDESMLHLL